LGKQIAAELVREKHPLLCEESSRIAAEAIQDIIDYWEDYGEQGFADLLREAFDSGKSLRYLGSHHDVRIDWRLLLEAEDGVFRNPRRLAGAGISFG